ncbi:MAG: zinc ribbon domain-containing protein [Halodesulfurarchaeum sp.]
MTKITFRADDDLVESVEAMDASKSEVMRRALRAYLDGQQSDLGGMTGSTGSVPVDELIAQRVDELVAARLTGLNGADGEVSVNVSLEPEEGEQRRIGEVSGGEPRTEGESFDDPSYSIADEEEPQSCSQCGTELEGQFVYCPNCGEKVSRRIFCECGSEIRSDWSFCPHCGRRTASADVLE